MLSAQAMQRIMRKEILDTVEDSLKRKHSEMADRVEQSIMTGKLAARVKVAAEEVRCHSNSIQWAPIAIAAVVLVAVILGIHAAASMLS